MKSMTGYGEKLVNQEGVEVFVQIKTLNHRFLQISVTSSEQIPWRWETEIENRVKGKVSRGKVLVNLQINKRGSKFTEVEPNVELANSCVEALKTLQKKLNLGDNIRLSHLLNFPEMLKVQEKGWESLEEVLYGAINDALGQVNKTRKQEGGKHKQEILKCIKKIKSCMAKIEEEFPSSQKKYRERMQEEIEKIISQKENEEKSNQIASNLGTVITKGDITEEIVRFNSHLEQFDKTLNQKTSIGKKLGFLLQELQREINTIGAKSLSSIIPHQVVQIKDNIEKIREQAYNIE